MESNTTTPVAPIHESINPPMNQTPPTTQDEHLNSQLTCILQPALVAPTCLAEVGRRREPSEGGTGNLELATINSQPPTINHSVIDAKPLPSTVQPRKIRRNGRIASLPKVHRDMVNRMLWNAVPYKNIVGALSEADFTVTERNISNWATGGYLEWRLEQEAVLANRLDQDHLVDFLRRDDAQDLPEVGLQAAATRLSQVLLQKLAGADDPEAHLDNYTKLIDLLCRLNREIAVTQKLRDDSRRTLGKEHDPVLVKDVEHVDAIEFERHYSNPDPDSELPKPAEPPLLPPIPTATFLAGQAREERLAQEVRESKKTLSLLKWAAESTLSKSKSSAPQRSPESPASSPLVLPAA
jgi:hypothetical protein